MCVCDGFLSVALLRLGWAAVLVLRILVDFPSGEEEKVMLVRSSLGAPLHWVSRSEASHLSGIRRCLVDVRSAEHFVEAVGE